MPVEAFRQNRVEEVGAVREPAMWFPSRTVWVPSRLWESNDLPVLESILIPDHVILGDRVPSDLRQTRTRDLREQRELDDAFGILATQGRPEDLLPLLDERLMQGVSSDGFAWLPDEVWGDWKVLIQHVGIKTAIRQAAEERVREQGDG